MEKWQIIAIKNETNRIKYAIKSVNAIDYSLIKVYNYIVKTDYKEIAYVFEKENR